jgi:hypothetical protein
VQPRIGNILSRHPADDDALAQAKQTHGGSATAMVVSANAFDGAPERMKLFSESDLAGLLK